MGKRKPVHWSVLNDSDLEHSDAIAILEPYVYKDPADDKPTQGNHRNWNIFLPTTQKTEGHIRHSYRAAIWTNRTVQAQQIPIDSHDMVAVTITGKQRKMLLIAAYDPGMGVTPVGPGRRRVRPQDKANRRNDRRGACQRTTRQRPKWCTRVYGL
jgi:hypothetical protein